MKRRVLGDVERAPQDRAESRVPSADVVKTRVDGTMVHQPHRLAHE